MESKFPVEFGFPGIDEFTLRMKIALNIKKKPILDIVLMPFICLQHPMLCHRKIRKEEHRLLQQIW